MKKNVKTVGRVKELSRTASKLIGHKIDLYEVPGGKEFRLVEHTAAGEIWWPINTATIREVGMALEFLISVAPNVIKTGVMGFTLSPAETLRHEVERNFDKVLDAIRAKSGLMDCLEAMEKEFDKLPASVSLNDKYRLQGAISSYRHIFISKGAWVPNAERNIRYFIRAWKELSMPFMTKMYQSMKWGTLQVRS